MNARQCSTYYWKNRLFNEIILIKPLSILYQYLFFNTFFFVFVILYTRISHLQCDKEILAKLIQCVKTPLIFRESGKVYLKKNKSPIGLRVEIRKYPNTDLYKKKICWNVNCYCWPVASLGVGDVGSRWRPSKAEPRKQAKI